MKSSWFLRTALALGLSLVLSLPCLAAQIDVFDGTLPGPQPNSASKQLPAVAADGMLTMTVTVDPALVSQYTTLALKDASDGTISFTYVMTSPKELRVPVAPGTYTVYIHNGVNTPGAFSVTTDYQQANAQATESEVNDSRAQANTVASSVFGGSIGYKRSASETDLSDWYVLEVAADGVLQLVLQAAATMVNINATYLSLYDANGERISYELVGSTQETLRSPLAPGTFYVQVFLGLGSLYGAYTITSSLETPCSEAVSESEVNDTLEQANQAQPLTIGSVGYIRSKDVRDTADYFSFRAPRVGASYDVLFTPVSDTLTSFNGTVHCWDPQGEVVDWNYLTGAYTFRFTSMEAGTYACRVRPEGGKYGCYTFDGFPDPNAGSPAVAPLQLLLQDSQ